MSRLKRQQPTRGSRERVRLLVVQHTSPSHDQHPWQLLPVLPNGRRLQRSNNSTGQPGPDELVRPLRPLRHRPSRCLYGVNIQHQEPRSLGRQRRLLRKRSRCKGNHRHSNLPADKLHHIILAIPQHQNTPSSFFLDKSACGTGPVVVRNYDEPSRIPQSSTHERRNMGHRRRPPLHPYGPNTKVGLTGRTLRDGAQRPDSSWWCNRDCFAFVTCEGYCKGDVSSISCNESTPHTSSISPTEICHPPARVLRMTSPIV